MPLQMLRRSATAAPKGRDVQVSWKDQPLLTLSPDEADRLAAELQASAQFARARREVERGI